MPAARPGSGGGRVLFIRGGAVGDLILTLPAIRLVRERLAGSRVEILGYPSIADLAREWGLVDRVRALEHRALSRFFVPGAELDAEWCGWLAGFDVVVSYLFDPDGIFHANLCRAGATTILRGPHRPDEAGPPAAAQLAAPLESLALFAEPGDLARTFVEPGQPVGRRIAFHPGSGSPRKNWPLERWLSVLESLRGQLREPISLISGEAEAANIREIEGRLAKAGLAFDRFDSIPLPELARHLRTCRLFLGHDSGISHLAAACSVPCVLVFGPTNPVVWGPRAPAVRLVSAPDGDLDRLDPGPVIAAIEDLA